MVLSSAFASLPLTVTKRLAPTSVASALTVFAAPRRLMPFTSALKSEVSWTPPEPALIVPPAIEVSSRGLS